MKNSKDILNIKNSKKKIVKLMNLLIMLLLITFMIACNNRKVEEKQHSFRAINGRDTAYLSLTTGDNYFIGKYEIFYGHKTMKDSGYVRGKIVGDTLLGAYYYKSYGGLGLSKPIALLMKEDKLLLGTGVQSSVLGLVFFTTDVPINYDQPIFIFEKFQKKK
jgi:hypothetical protein